MKHETLTCRKLQPFKMVLLLAEFTLLLVTKYLIFPSAFTWLGAPGNPQVLRICQRSQENRLCRNRQWMRDNGHPSGSPLQGKILWIILLSCSHSFKPNLSNQTHYFHPLLLFAKSDAAGRISGSAWPGALLRDNTWQRNCINPFHEALWSRREYVFGASTELEAIPPNVFILTKVNKFCWVGVLLIFFFLTSCTIAKKLMYCQTFQWLSNEKLALNPTSCRIRQSLKACSQ